MFVRELATPLVHRQRPACVRAAEDVQRVAVGARIDAELRSSLVASGGRTTSQRRLRTALSLIPNDRYVEGWLDTS